MLPTQRTMRDMINEDPKPQHLRVLTALDQFLTRANGVEDVLGLAETQNFVGLAQDDTLVLNMSLDQVMTWMQLGTDEFRVHEYGRHEPGMTREFWDKVLKEMAVFNKPARIRIILTEPRGEAKTPVTAEIRLHWLCGRAGYSANPTTVLVDTTRIVRSKILFHLGSIRPQNVLVITNPQHPVQFLN